MGGKSFRSLVIVCAMALMTAFLLVGCQSAEQPLQEANQLSWRELPAEQQTIIMITKFRMLLLIATYGSRLTAMAYCRRIYPIVCNGHGMSLLLLPVR